MFCALHSGLMAFHAVLSCLLSAVGSTQSILSSFLSFFPALGKISPDGHRWNRTNLTCTKTQDPHVEGAVTLSPFPPPENSASSSYLAGIQFCFTGPTV